MGDKERLFEYVEEHRDDLISTLRDLVRIDTQVPPGKNYEKICGLIADKLTAVGCDVTIHNATERYLTLSGVKQLGLEGPRSNVVARLKGKGGGPSPETPFNRFTCAVLTKSKDNIEFVLFNPILFYC